MLKTVWSIIMKLSIALGIEWAPLNIPLSRRLQTLAATTWIVLVIFGQSVAILLFIKLIYSSYWYLGLLYALWMLNDIDVCHKGGRTIQWVRNWALWRYYRDYYPIKLVKTVDLDPTRNYLFACYPHGIICSGPFVAFGTNALDFYKLFPGLTCHLITLAGHFLVPLFRELSLAFGTCASTKESLEYLLDRKRHQGKCVCLMVGGAAEALDSHPGEYKVVLSRRKGFIRIALSSGASIVPVFSFGETDVFRPPQNPKESFLRKFQETVRRITGISPIFLIGRGVFQYSFGLLPLRAPITTVVGAPLEVQKNPEPTDEEVNAIQEEFKKRLIDLFETEKPKYLKNHEKTTLIIS